MEDLFTSTAIKEIKRVPYGKVSTYGFIAKLCGDNRGAQRVAEILHLHSEKYALPWHRIINSQGEIAINNPEIAQVQRRLLEKEGIVFAGDIVNLKKYLFDPNQVSLGGYF